MQQALAHAYKDQELAIVGNCIGGGRQSGLGGALDICECTNLIPYPTHPPPVTYIHGTTINMT